jgi:cytochrome bd-type quinol oxidase subunit 2
MQAYTTTETRVVPAAASEARVMWSWSAVIAGTLTSLIIQVMLTMLGIGVGLIVTDVPTASNAPVAVSAAAILWFIASGIFSAFVGGAVAGALTPYASDRSRSAHALATWALATLIVVGATMLTATGAGTVAGQLAGPSVNATARVATLQRVQPGAPAPTPAQLEAARKAAATTMFASFIGLVLGAVFAFIGGRWSDEIRDHFADR